MKKPVLFMVFNRLDTTKQVYAEIKKYQPAKLYLAADGPRAGRLGESERCQQVRDFVLSGVDWDCEVITLFREHNRGCKNAVSEAISWFFEHEESGIILEDDCVPSQTFFSYCSDMLDRYKDDESITHVSGTNYGLNDLEHPSSYRFSEHFCVWGWASWRRAWKVYDVHLDSWNPHLILQKMKERFQNSTIELFWLDYFLQIVNRQLDTWDIQWLYINFIWNRLSIVPNTNLISNIGFGADATHTTYEVDPYVNLPRGEIAVLEHPSVRAIAKEFDLRIYKEHYRLPIAGSSSASDWPIISVITPSYNQAHFLAKTLQSVLSQIGPFYIDFIIQDGGSTDGSVAIIQEFEARLKRECDIVSHGGRDWFIPREATSLVQCLGASFQWVSKRDGGQAQAINNGFEKAIGGLGTWLNSDDYYTEYALLSVFKKSLEFPGEVLCGSAQALDENGKQLWIHSYNKELYTIKEWHFDKFVPPQPSIFFPVRLFNKVNGLKVKYRYMLDTELWSRMLKEAGHFRYFDKILSVQCYHPDSKSMEGGVLFSAFRSEEAVMRRKWLHSLPMRDRLIYDTTITNCINSIRATVSSIRATISRIVRIFKKVPRLIIKIIKLPFRFIKWLCKKILSLGKKVVKKILKKFFPRIFEALRRKSEEKL